MVGGTGGVTAVVSPNYSSLNGRATMTTKLIAGLAAFATVVAEFGGCALFFRCGCAAPNDDSEEILLCLCL
ncbi:MAG: hypothetical protein H6658_07205 [Ardenticatenaceae bacterium]|nr:hypothetical protein [Ardenticatenaceae bacterium]